MWRESDQWKFLYNKNLETLVSSSYRTCVCLTFYDNHHSHLFTPHICSVSVVPKATDYRPCANYLQINSVRIFSVKMNVWHLVCIRCVKMYITSISLALVAGCIPFHFILCSRSLFSVACRTPPPRQDTPNVMNSLVFVNLRGSYRPHKSPLFVSCSKIYRITSQLHFTTKFIAF